MCYPKLFNRKIILYSKCACSLLHFHRISSSNLLFHSECVPSHVFSLKRYLQKTFIKTVITHNCDDTHVYQHYILMLQFSNRTLLTKFLAVHMYGFLILNIDEVYKCVKLPARNLSGTEGNYLFIRDV